MGNSISNYTFTVIKDNPVPLAGSFDTFSYMPVIAAVILAIIAVSALLYTVWFYSHSARFTMYSGMKFSDVVKEFYVHPIRMSEAGRELDHRILGKNAA